MTPGATTDTKHPSGDNRFKLLDRTINLTRQMQKGYGFGLKPSDTILTTGGSSRMPTTSGARG